MAKMIMIKNCPVMVKDINNANKIFGTDTAALKRKTVQFTQDIINTDYVVLLPDLIKLHKNIDLDIDVLYVNKIPFLVLHTKHICFATLKHVMDRAKKSKKEVHPMPTINTTIQKVASGN
eukprot:8582179-Ditylum_brightwellii.AAC.1